MLSRVGSVVLTAMAMGKNKTVTLTEVFITPEIVRKIIAYGKIYRKGFGLVFTVGDALSSETQGRRSRV